MTTFLMVDVESIISSVPRSHYSEAELDRLADQVLETKGLLKPLILKKSGFETYEVVDGHLEYYAAVRASEKNPRQGEMVNALIIAEGSEAAAINQVKTIQKLTTPPYENGKKTTDIILESRLTNLELRFEKGFNQIREEQLQERARVDNKFREIEITLQQIQERARVDNFREIEITPQQKQIDPLEILNTLEKNELEIKLQRSKIRGAQKLAQNIVEARRKKSNKAFINYQDVVKSVQGLGEKTIVSIIDDWLRL